MDLLLTGRWVDANEAKSWGLIKDIVKDDELRDAAWSLARTLETGPPLVFAAIKEIVRETEDMKAMDALNRVSKRQFGMWTSSIAVKISWKGRVPLLKNVTLSGKGNKCPYHPPYDTNITGEKAEKFRSV